MSVAILLSRAAVLAMVVYFYVAWRVLSLDPGGRANRAAFAFNIVFAVWAVGASFWYASPTAEDAARLYRAFSWTWSLFPPLIVHFTLLAASHQIVAGRKRMPLLVALYLPSAMLAVAVPLWVLAPPRYTAGYWMLAIRPNPVYYIFVAHYLGMIGLAVWLTFKAYTRAKSRRASRRFAILGWSYIGSVSMGFLTDTVFLYTGLPVPNLAIFWVLILSFGMLVAMERYGFLSRIPRRDAEAVLERMGEFIVFLDDIGRVVWMNGSAMDVLGVASLDEARHFSCADLLPERAAGREANRNSENDHLEPAPIPVVSTFGPEAIPVQMRMLPLGPLQTDGFLLVARDLRPELRQESAERRLADIGAVMDAFIDRSLDGIAMTDTAGTVVRWNPPMATMTGIHVRDALGQLYWDLRAMVEPPEGRSRWHLERAVREMLDPALEEKAHRLRESVIVRLDGTRRLVQYDSLSLPLSEGHVLLTIARDVTDERRMAEETIERIKSLDHAQKMEAIGTLSGGIAHDFNNTLAGIIGALSLIEEGIQSGEMTTTADISGELRLIHDASHRAASSVRRLLTLTRKRAPETVDFQLDQSLRKVVEFARSTVDAAVIISLHDDVPRARVIGDQGQMEQLILNLIINAEHAMTIMRPRGQERGGTVTLTLGPYRPSPSRLAANPSIEDRDYWALSVQDQGVGIPRHIQSRIFDPFYTTKTVEASSGLGLSMVQAIARQHGGFIDLVSTEGYGAEFIVYIPAVNP